MDINEDDIRRSESSDPSTHPDQTEIPINADGEILTSDQAQEKPIWGKLENCLSGCLSFLILIALPYVFWGVMNYLYEEDSIADQKSREETRQEALEENWNKFLDRADTHWYHLQPENFELALCPFSSSETWSHSEDPEEAGFFCGFITVPLDHSRPTGETIQIPVAIWPSYEPGTQPDPLVITHGGPGGSILEYAPSKLYPGRIGTKRDLVFVDQRGTRYAQPNLICPEVTEEIYGAFNPEQEKKEYDYKEYLNYCRARLAGKGIDLTAFTTPQIARDFEVVRKTFGYHLINFYGVSYGTHVGQYLAEYYPDNIRSLILDGVAPVPLDYLNRSVSTRTRILNEIFTSCDQDPICAEYYPDLANRLSAVIKRLDQNPEQVRLGFGYRFYPLELDGQFFFNYLLSIAYMDQNYAVLPYIIKEAENNRFDYFKAWVDWRIDDLSERSLAYYAVVCSEHQPFTQFDQNNMDLDIPIISWENSDLEEMEQICSSLGIDHSPDTLEMMPETHLRTLLLSGYYDPVTPPEYGELVLNNFLNGQHIIDPVGSHGIALSIDCPTFIMYQFLEDPDKDIDLDCLGDPDRRDKVVPPTALSSWFMLKKKDVPSLLLYLPVCMMLLAFPRFIIRGIKWIWKKIKKINPILSKSEKLLQVRFELTNWVFWLCSFSLGFGLFKFDENLRPTIYRHALALNEEARLLMLIPPILLILFPILIYFTIRIWKVYSTVLTRVYLLLNSSFVLITMGVISFNDMLLVWTR